MDVRHYHTPSGRDLVARFLQECSAQVRSDYFDAITMLGNGEMLYMPLSRPLNDVFPGLHELRFKDADGIYRFLYILKKKDAIYVVHAFKKKTEKLPDKDKKLVLKRIKEI